MMFFIYPKYGFLFLAFLFTGACIPARGDTILFTGGVEYDRNLELEHAGSVGSPLVITSSGNGKAIILAGSGFGLHLKNSRNVTIENLEFRGSGRLSGNVESGVIIEDCENITIRDIDIHGFQHSGLYVTGASQWISVEEVYTHDNGFAGIHVMGEWPDKVQCRNLYIGHCRAENNPGDPTVLANHSGNGIIVGSCDSILIEYCEALENGWDMPRGGNGPVGIWAWNADHVTIQRCISHHNKTSPTGHDGGGFDLDGGVTNSLVQYCLSYENEGAGYGIFEYASAGPFRNNTVRYNISINDGIKNGNTSVMFWNGNQDPAMLSDSRIHNNVLYNDRYLGTAINFLDDDHMDILIANNIFITGGPAIKGPYMNAELRGNVYWSPGIGFGLDGYTSFQEWITSTGQEKMGDSVVGMNLDPLLSDPGKVTVTDPDSLIGEALSGFRLQAQSPVIDRGLDLLSLFGIDPGVSDFFGQTVPAGAGFEPGIYEYQPVTWTGGRTMPERSCRAIVFRDPWEMGAIRIRLKDGILPEEIWYIVSDLSGRVVRSGVLTLTVDWQTIQIPQNSLESDLYFFTAMAAGKDPCTIPIR
jgi:hypothetical protein